jgi:Neutral/alkaline non-lysosomal ceramidase, N-terminal
VIVGKRFQLSNHVAVFVAVTLLASCFAANAEEMKAGVAKADITPPLGTQMWGYFDRLKGAEGILDPLYARVLVLEAGEKQLAYVDLDLGRTFGPASLEKLRQAVKQGSGIDDLIVQATHTHAGPVVMDQYPSGTPAWETAALGKIEQAVHEAQAAAVPVRLGVGYGEATIGYNRRRVNSDGSVTMIWQNPERIPTWPVDSTLTLLRVDRMDGTPLAILVNDGTHPVTFGGDNLRFSADFPGVMCKVVEQAFDGKPLAFFVQGAPGDINVYDATTPMTQDAVGRRDWAGETIGKAAAEAAKQIQTQSDSNPSIDFSEDTLPFDLRWNPEKFRKAILDEIGPKGFEVYAPPIQETMHMPVTTALIDRNIALMGMPGEPFVQFQMDWRAECPVDHCFFLGYANGYNGYFPTIQAASEGGYGATSATTWVQVGAGERMVNHALREIYRMLGRLQDAPNANWKNLR